jgi:hypothetical protein
MVDKIDKLTGIGSTWEEYGVNEDI